MLSAISRFWSKFFLICYFIAIHHMLAADLSSTMDLSSANEISFSSLDMDPLTNDQQEFFLSNQLESSPISQTQFSSSDNSLTALCPQFPSTLPFPPTHLRGRQVANKFATQTDLVNIITWEPPLAGPSPVAYYIYRNENLSHLAAIIPAHRKLKFKDHNRKPHHTYSYFIVAVHESGNQSPPAGIVFHGKKARSVESIVPVSIAIQPLNPSIAVGSTQQFIATVTFSNGSIRNLTDVDWCSEDPLIVAIDASGLAIGLVPGITTVTATFGGISALTTITVVTEPPVCLVPTITTTSLSDGAVGDFYLEMLSAMGSTPITFSIVSGSLPPGLELDSETGLIFGTPTTEGTFVFTVQATNACGSAIRAFSITICLLPTITTTTLDMAFQGEPYSATISATGSTPITFSIVAGALPDGLTLNAATGEISGVPGPGTGSPTGITYPFTVEATNACGSDTQDLSITVSILF